MADSLKVVQEAGLYFMANLRDAVGDVDRKRNRHVFSVLRVTGRAQCPAVECHLLREFCPWVDRGRDKHRIALFPSEHSGLWSIGCDPERRVRFLQRLGHDSCWRHLGKLAVKATGLLCPRLFDKHQRFLKTCAAWLT